jgi:hypothetical protein
MAHDEQGREIPDQTPLEAPFAVRKPESIEDMIRRFVRTEASRIAEKEGYESFEEADDFSEDPDDEVEDPYSQYYVHETEMAPLDSETPESLDGSPGEPVKDEPEAVDEDSKTDASSQAPQEQ